MLLFSIRDIAIHSSSNYTTSHLLPHINHAANAVSLFHSLKSRIDLGERLSMSDELIDLQLALHVIINQVRKLSAALNSAKSTSLENHPSVKRVTRTKRIYLPNTASNELEC
jgi:hypothetical protein